MKKSLVMSTVLLMASNFACADEGSNDGSEICRAQDGVEITSLGEVSKGVDVEDVVVCSILPSNMKSSQRAPTLPPLQRMIISAMPSPGTVTVSAGGDRKFTTSCRANLYAPRYANFYPDGVSRGTSDLRCVGYNTPGNSSQGCNVSWVGPTDIQLGVEPYGGSVVVNYSCTAFKTTIPVIMSYSYRDGRAVYGEVQNVSGIINVVLK
ncbi:TPA: hypothetical protein L4856_002253 [Pseudomonas aeruginosa]|nr:hypothetical protein [Pseudomonas aeruginosa]HBO7141897.1 hypothetical protein [Pseudomonas aeruginosa]